MRPWELFNLAEIGRDEQPGGKMPDKVRELAGCGQKEDEFFKLAKEDAETTE